VSSKIQTIGAIEIGSSKIRVLIGEISHGRGPSLNIISKGECQSRGVVKGDVVDLRAAGDAAHTAIHEAESGAGGLRIDRVFLAQTGGHLEGFYNEASVNVRSADYRVTQADIDSVCELATGRELPDGRALVDDGIRQPFFLDGSIVSDARNLRGRVLKVGYWMVHGDSARLASNLDMVRGFNLKVDALILSSLASGIMVTTPEERAGGVIAIDIGAGTTDYVLYRAGCACMTGVVPVGGLHLTNDLCNGLRLGEGQAEKTKTRFGSGVVVTRDRGEKVWLDGDRGIGDRQLSKNSIELITSLRVAEIFEIVKKRLGPEFSPDQAVSGVVVTGGTSQLPGIADAAAAVFGLPARAGEFPGRIHEQLRDPGWATVLGLLHFGLDSTTAPAAPGPRAKGGWLRKLFS
jgi:cell division protein FtsA